MKAVTILPPHCERAASLTYPSLSRGVSGYETPNCSVLGERGTPGQKICILNCHARNSGS